MPVPSIRVRAVHDAPLRDGDYLVYWMTAYRRLAFNPALERAVELAQERRKPLVILEPLRAGYPWACDRFHRFVIDGMREHAAALRKSRVLYYPYLEPTPGAGKGLLKALAKRAVAVVGDDYPAYFLPRMMEAAGRQLEARLEAVDGFGVLPLAATERAFPTAYSFRRFLQKSLAPHLAEPPAEDPLDVRLPAADALPSEILKRWPAADLDVDLASFPIDHAVGPAPMRGGESAARVALKAFLRKLDRYDDDRNHPDLDATSGLSPWLHFGHISSHEVLASLGRHRFPRRTDGRRGAWGLSAGAEAFLDQLVTWRELGANFCHVRPDYDRYASLPGWARATLEAHAEDGREHIYPLEEMEAAKTGDPIWNAAQTQLVREGRLHNYMRMLWGKRVIGWTRSPREALDVLLHLNNKYAVDGRDPNSYSGIFWCFGRYDRAWGPERPVFGKVRYMSSASAARKLKLKAYVRRWSGPG